jgi:L-cysteine/cystine lyase
LDCTEPLLETAPPAGLVSFRLRRADGEMVNPEEIVAILGEQAIWLRSLPDPACLRACTHLTTTEEEVELLLDALARL